MTTTKKRSERDDFLMNHTISKDIERRIKEREESRKKTAVCLQSERPQAAEQEEKLQAAAKKK